MVHAAGLESVVYYVISCNLWRVTMRTLRVPRTPCVGLWMIDNRLEELWDFSPSTGIPNTLNRLGAWTTGAAKGKLSCFFLGEPSTENQGKDGHHLREITDVNRFTENRAELCPDQQFK